MCSALTLVLLSEAGCSSRVGGERSHTKITSAQNQTGSLHAFARLYGALRWFHPSDAAAALDWDRFAIEGVRRVVDITDATRLRDVLLDLIAPVAPTVRIATADEALPPFMAAPPGADLVAWEHLGYGDSTLISAYASKRRHRPRTVAAPGVPQAALWQSVDATPFRGARVRLSGRLRAAHHGRARLWLRIDRSDQIVFSDSMSDRPVGAATWQAVEIVGNVDPAATVIAFGVVMAGGGTTWFDDLDLAAEVNGAWSSVAIHDSGFEAKELFASWKPGTSASDSSLQGWDVALDVDHPATGSAALRIQQASRMLTSELFADSPAPGETIDIDLGSGLRARVPIALYSSNGHTIGDDPEQARAFAADDETVFRNSFDRKVAIADVIVLWNVLEHFWPYWDTLSVDWSAALDRTLTDALHDRSVVEHIATLRRLSALAADGHASTTCPGSGPRATPPFLIDVIEGQIVVTATTDAALARGDVVISVDRRPASAQLAEDKAALSGSPQWRLARARQRFAAGPPGSSLSLRLRRGNAEFDAVVVRNNNVQLEFPHPAIERLPDGVYYVSLDRAEMAEIKAIIDKLAVAPGIVFDLRDYPNSNDDVLSYLLTGPAEITAGMSIPRVIRPDHTRTSIPSWETADAKLPALQPHIWGRVAFVTGPGAISYAETVLAIVERYHLGAIVGSTTAGTNGNIAEVSEPSGCRTKFTGMRVTKPDGSRFHLIGITPTIQATRTLAGVVAGRDEVLEKALAYVRERTK